MGSELPLDALVGFLLAMVRTSAWMITSPPFNTKIIPRLVKVGIAAGIALPISTQMPTDQISLETGPMAALIFTQLATGLMLGFITQVLFAAAQSAGNLIDLFGGFTLSQALDPLLNAQVSIFGRFYGLLATTLLFMTSGHLLLIKGFMTSFQAVPLTGIQFQHLQEQLLASVSSMMIASIEIAGPLLAAYFLADITLGLLSKAAPQLNILMFGFPFKILITLLLVASALPILPNAIEHLVEMTLRTGMGILRGGG